MLFLQQVIVTVILIGVVFGHNIVEELEPNFNGPKKYQTVENKLYYHEGMEYTVIKTPATFEEARFSCQDEKRESSCLLQLTNMRVANYIAEVLSELRPKLDAVWIGAQMCMKYLIYRNETDSTKFCWEDPATRPVYQNMTKNIEEGLLPIPFVERSDIQELAGERNRCCLAFRRNLRNKPLFVDMNCYLKRAYICQKRVFLSEKMPTKLGVQNMYVKGSRAQYTLYYARKTWKSAARYCMMNRMQIAKVYTERHAQKLEEMLLHRGAGLEQVWINGYFEKGELKYIRPRVKSDKLNRYKKYPEHLDVHAGCLTMDRHYKLLTDYSVRADHCGKRLSFICETFLQPMYARNIMNHVVVEKNGTTYLLMKKKYPWFGTLLACHELGATVAMPLNMAGVYVLATLMSECEFGAIESIWLGASKHHLTSEWRWMTGHRFFTGNEDEYPPMWWNISTPMPHMNCLNMDVYSFDRPIWYEQWCGFKQQTICIKLPEPTLNWSAYDPNILTANTPAFLASDTPLDTIAEPSKFTIFNESSIEI